MQQSLYTIAFSESTAPTTNRKHHKPVIYLHKNEGGFMYPLSSKQPPINLYCPNYTYIIYTSPFQILFPPPIPTQTTPTKGAVDVNDHPPSPLPNRPPS